MGKTEKGANTRGAKPIWKRYAKEKHPRRKWSNADAHDYNLARENYHAVVEAVMEGGLTWEQAGEHCKISRKVAGKIARRWRKQQQALWRKREFLREGDWANGITERFKERLLEVAEAPVGITTEKYNQMKIGQTHFKGTGIYQVGETARIGTQNNVFITTAEEAERILRLANSAREPKRITTGGTEQGTLESPERNSREDREGRFVVGAELHSDV